MVTHLSSQPLGAALAPAGIRAGCLPVLVTDRAHTPHPLLSLLRDSTLLTIGVSA
ncbi:hypothetical protein [Ideonella sp. YS5]|uniref:hypothetical protein n=1 Tax=Ideonella sp. YS5 TaxID=3453714 RepID=UPI003F6E7EEC